MPFGKYSGRPLAEIPTDYLSWLLSVELRPWLRDAVASEYKRRIDEYDREYTPPPPPASGIRIRPEELPLARRLVEAGYRSLARLMHPDKGGDVREMQRLNALAESVRTQIDLLEQAIR
jgi:hypothetical protein